MDAYITAAFVGCGRDEATQFSSTHMSAVPKAAVPETLNSTLHPHSQSRAGAPPGIQLGVVLLAPILMRAAVVFMILNLILPPALLRRLGIPFMFD